MSDELKRRPLLMRVLDAMQEADNYYVSPDQAQVAIALTRAEVLEEAARVAETVGATAPEANIWRGAYRSAAAIRALEDRT